MPSGHLPAHMDSVRQKCRPKHQVIILKCYPRLPKNSSADVKPNGSELSYLLFYSASRRSKLQKVGGFLERKTASDVYKQQSARVIVTLQIVTALLENKVVGEGSTLALIAPYVLRIISGILRDTTDISLIEATLKAWDVFCKHQDQAILAADHEYRELYNQVVGQYAVFAHKTGGKKLGKSTVAVAVQDAIRLREIGLHAFLSVLHSDISAFESGKTLLAATVPAILSNLRGNDGAHLERLVRLSKKTEAEDKERAQFLRQSLATIRTHTATSERDVEADPRAAEGTAQDADKLAEEGVALLAVDCLRAVFNTENRAQVRSATTAVLRYLSDLQQYQRPQTSTTERSAHKTPIDTWSTKLFQMCTAWTPVQDRFILLVTTVEALTHLHINDSTFCTYHLHAYLIDNVLRSDLNLIGLSVMDVELGLMHQMLRVLHLPEMDGNGTSLRVSDSSKDIPPVARLSSQCKLRLRNILKDCIAHLATHIYYSEQISDMVAAILLRLKPNMTPTGQSDPVATAAAVEDPRGAVKELASNASLHSHGRSGSTNSYFAFETARQIALETVRDIVKVANSTDSHHSTGVAANRSPVHITVWEGTQWLLRDPASIVRYAYDDALVTWLELETSKNDWFLAQANSSRNRRGGGETTNAKMARRAASNASAAARDRLFSPTSDQNTSSSRVFLQLLHLANYENALQFAATSPEDMVRIHELLVTLADRLGANAATCGVPTMFALQEEIPRMASDEGKMWLASLVHGYFFSLVHAFDIDQEQVGRAVIKEMARRVDKGVWVNEIQFPPLKTSEPIDEEVMSINGLRHPSTHLSANTVVVPDVPNLQEELPAFGDRVGLQTALWDAYQRFCEKPPTSPPGSPGHGIDFRPMPTSSDSQKNAAGQTDLLASPPGRGMNAKALERPTSYLSARPTPVDPQVLAEAKMEMMQEWSREKCMESIRAMVPKTTSLSGSRSSPQTGRPNNSPAAGNHRQLLAATNIPGRQASKSSAGRSGSSIPTRPIGVEELKKTLATGIVSTKRRGGDADDTASESMMEVGDDLGSDWEGSQGLSGKGKKGRFDAQALVASIVVGKDVKRMAEPPY